MRKFKRPAMLLTVLLSAIALNACNHIPVKDKEVCADLGVAGAQCAHVYISKRREVPKAQWDRIRVGWMCMSSDDFSDTEDAIDELCRTTNLCDYKTAAEYEKFKARMLPIIQRARAAARAFFELKQ